jgi:hypothetical protein
MQLFVKTPNMGSVQLQVDGKESVFALKALLNGRTGIPVGDQVLVHGGNVLASDKPLADYQIASDSTVWMLLRLRGGAGDGVTLHVKILGSRTVDIKVASLEVAVEEIHRQLKEVEGLEAGNYELWYQGQKLEANSPLSAYQINSPQATLDVTLPTKTTKNRCFYNDCPGKVAKIIGDCRYCGHGYCAKHRLPESHACDNINHCREQSFERNSHKLLGEKCVGDKLSL